MPHCALLIDTENMGCDDPAACLRAIMEELHSECEIIVKRVYGDFSSDQLRKWEAPLRATRVKPVAPTGEKGKKACDMLLVVDAMDLMHQNSKVDIFALATSDADFAPLADRLREAGKVVYGVGFFGRASTAFMKACHRFVAVENLTPKQQTTATKQRCKSDAQAAKAPGDAGKRAKAAVRLLEASRPDYDGWVQCSTVNDYLRRQDSSWDVRTWGYDNVRDFFDHVKSLETAAFRQGVQSCKMNNYVRLRPKQVDAKTKKKCDAESPQQSKGFKRAASSAKCSRRASKRARTL
eukprot:TRINITY_DN124007_c0_g1_i1.p1 TRINITY_DN124007_c0_g1~~TRINITY_DN124007_c0_g1_i1.p1  ORF type:complete len:314 (+),score=42.23 TRINITY_DN124007_c0_g1_i1:62-943(+)